MSTSLQALNAVNFFMADVRDGLGPYLGVFLQQQQWSPTQIAECRRGVEHDARRRGGRGLRLSVVVHRARQRGAGRAGAVDVRDAIDVGSLRRQARIQPGMITSPAPAAARVRRYCR